jgi:uncharacterized protein
VPVAVQPNVGIGLRHPHYQALLESLPPLGFVEVHSENFFALGGATCAVLQEARKHYDVSLHGVGLSLGSAAPLDAKHLEALALLVDRVQPCRVSDHASFARAAPHAGATIVHAHDLLPLAFTKSALAILCGNVARVQDRLKRTLLVENVSAYVVWRDAEMSEPEFLNQLHKRTGCSLLLDVNNLVVNALNHHAGTDPVAYANDWIDQIDAVSVGEIHLAGYQDMGDIVIDNHSSCVHAPVWQVFRHAVRRCGAVPTLVEWDTDLPALEVLLGEAQIAANILAELGSSGYN